MAWVEIVTWGGTIEQAGELHDAIEHNCECEKLKRRCGAHAAMLDQRFIDGILFARHLLPRLRREEYSRSCISPRSETIS